MLVDVCNHPQRTPAAALPSGPAPLHREFNRDARSHLTEGIPKGTAALYDHHARFRSGTPQAPNTAQPRSCRAPTARLPGITAGAGTQGKSCRG